MKFEKHGPLNKLGEGGKGWHARVGALSEQRKTLFLFDSEDDFKKYCETEIPKLVEPIQLHNTTIYVAPYADEHKPWCFELRTLDRLHFFNCDGEEEMKDWVFSLASYGVVLKTSQLPNPAVKSVPFRREYGMQGYLHKRGFLNTAFKYRFFRTMENAGGRKIIAYYKHHADHVPKGTINLMEAEVVENREPGAGVEEFVVVERLPRERRFRLKARTHEEKHIWMDVLRAIIDGSADTLYSSQEEEKEVNGKDPHVVDYYDVLGVAHDATREEIGQAFKVQARKYHPDKNHDAGATAMFQAVNEAYDTLGNSEKRAEYDESLRASGKAVSRPVTPTARSQTPAPVPPVNSPVPTPKATSSPRAEAKNEGKAAAAAPAPAATTAPVVQRQISQEEAEEKAKRTAIGLGRPPSTSYGTLTRERYEEEIKFKNNPKNMCERCGSLPQALYCHACSIDVCIGCSGILHKDPDMRSHRRVPMIRKQEFLRALLGDETLVIRKPGDHEESVHDETPAAEAPLAIEPPAKIETKLSETQLVPVHPEPPLTDEEDDKSPYRHLGRDVRQRIKEVEKGSEMYKIPAGVMGSARLANFFLRVDNNIIMLCWDSKKKASEDSAVDIKSCQLLHGQLTEPFKKKKIQSEFGDRAKQSFSLVSPKRTIDVVCATAEQYDNWTAILNAIIAAK